MRTWDEFIINARNRNILPKNIDFSVWNDWYVVSGYDSPSSIYISENVSMGISRDPKLAFKKCIIEYIERSVFSNCTDKAVAGHNRSNGVAAFPFLDNSSIQSCQKNARNEAVERYLWANWWDNPDFKHTELYISKFNMNIEIDNLIQSFNLSSLKLIQINDLNKDYLLIIFLAETVSGGFITGGAAESIKDCTSDFINLIERALGELLRHLISFERMKKNNNSDKFSFYEKRLFGFASGEWTNIVNNRLSKKGILDIPLPKIKLDTEILHSNNDLVYVHRVLFDNQPAFIGGRLERLCI